MPGGQAGACQPCTPPGEVGIFVWAGLLSIFSGWWQGRLPGAGAGKPARWEDYLFPSFIPPQHLELFLDHINFAACCLINPILVFAM